MSHTEVVNLVRAAPKVVDLVVGRVLEPPKPPIEAHLLPDITFQCHDEPLGNGNSNVYCNWSSLQLSGVLRNTQNPAGQVDFAVFDRYMWGISVISLSEVNGGFTG